MGKAKENYSEWAKDCYSEEWDEISKFAKMVTGRRCVLCGEECKTTHHAFYTKGGLEDKPGFNLFPLCDAHHGEAHQSKNWKVVYQNHPIHGRVTDPVHGRYNQEAFYRRLQAGWETYVLPTSEWEAEQAKFFRGKRARPSVAVADDSPDQNVQLAVLMTVVGLIVYFIFNS